MILAIETGVSAGSLAIYDPRKKVEIISSVGKAEVSKSEELLENLFIMLNRSHVSRESINTIVFGKNFGSLTGQKIGEALAKGLAKSLGSLFLKISIWDVLARIAEETNEEKIFYLPAGKSKVAKRIWKAGEFSNDIQNMDISLFNKDLVEISDRIIFAHKNLLDYIKPVNNFNVCSLGDSIAFLLAYYASDNETIVSHLTFDGYKE